MATSARIEAQIGISRDGRYALALRGNRGCDVILFIDERTAWQMAGAAGVPIVADECHLPTEFPA